MASYNQTLAMRYNRQGEEAVVDGHLHLAIKYFTDAIALWRSSPKCWCKLNSANLSFHKLKHTGFF
ncbi:hypothetical protein WNX12_10750, partial [Limosilactobacillus fermentum]